MPAHSGPPRWGDFPAPTAAQRDELCMLLAELDAGRTDSAPVRRWLDAHAPFAYLLRSVSLVKLRRRDHAARDVARAVELAPQSVLVRMAAARIRFILGDYTAAFADLDAAAVPSASALPTECAVALDWKFELARRLGGYAEALECVTAALRIDDSNQRRNVGRLEHAARLLQSISNYEGALRRIEAALAIEPESIGLHMRAAGLHSRMGDLEGTRRVVSAATGLLARIERDRAVAVRLECARNFIELGATDDALAQLRCALELDPANVQVLALLGQLALWAGHASEVARFAETIMDAGQSVGWRLRGALRVLAGDYVQALVDLDEALRRDPHDYEAHTWCGEAFYRTGQLENAFAALNRAGDLADLSNDYLAAQILRLLVQAARNEFPGLPSDVVSDALDCMFPGERKGSGLEDIPATCALLERALVCMRGNRSFTATYVRPDDAAEMLVPLRVQPSPRGPSKLALWLLTTEGFDSARRAFERVHREYPRSAEPHCYHGELYLYLGDYVAARKQFEQALAIYDRTRWAFIGLGAVELLEGHPERTLPLLERSVRLSRGAGPTLFVYRGEAQLHLGDLDAAIRDLEYATQLNPTRVSAWIDLGLARDMAGHSSGLVEALHHLRRVAPGLIHDASRAAQIAVTAAEYDGIPDREALRALFETMLRMMRGNRSSTCVTYFTDEGSLRVIPAVPSIDAEFERRELDLVRALLERALGLRRP